MLFVLFERGLFWDQYECSYSKISAWVLEQSVCSERAIRHWKLTTINCLGKNIDNILEIKAIFLFGVLQ